ncbi:uncharacterized protein LTR77_006242 [Saxophila tyrrhenica]|uniref:Carboxypeptidase n=1 Tax=Saxophila tyrrhenica TaxID=1690608 RepID=A0AAV9P865_9PEZI|nr:hypothetical protein LTR77_006242 [Saxophila tyrrhenica]
MRFSYTSLLAIAYAGSLASAANDDFNYYRRHQQQRLQNAAVIAQQQASLGAQKDYQYHTKKTAPYFIDSWPDVNFDAGEMYSGNVPIDESDPSRSLFFVFTPSEKPTKTLTIWLNGGPGCSSMVGFFQENGNILWQPGTYHATRNPYAWSKYTNVLWVEHPVGVGFSVGKVHARDELSISQDFIGFFKNFEKLFGIENYKIYVTGESYAGRYVPYISAAMLDQKDKQYFDLSGNVIYDPCIGEFLRVGQEIPTFDFVMANRDILNLNDTFIAQLEQEHINCGYRDYIDKYMQFPPPEHQPDRGVYGYKKCDVFDKYYEAAYTVNPCFNIYHITDYCPDLGDVMGNAKGISNVEFYFNRQDVKKALHAPLDVKWRECGGPVFKGRGGPEDESDQSPDPIQGVLPQVIEATNRVLVSNADWDGLLLTNGTLLSIQNMTWNGKLGFQSPPMKDFVVNLKDKQYGTGVQGIMGRQHYERGLLWVETFQAGHEQPQYQPRAALEHLRWMLELDEDS